MIEKRFAVALFLHSYKYLTFIIPYIRGSQMVGRGPKVGRGTTIFNIEFYEKTKIETLEVSRE